ncbi:mitochondrial carrier domain-containing protein [Apiospora rasikravindrae]|uniref:Mitochondrial carrier domain-containing protein n=1 Tax=Apiospora rasikravindrae TaxID=990691 RepID=A0ABR1SDR4_9PEZI
MTSRRGDTIITLPNNQQYALPSRGGGGGPGPVIPTDGMMPEKQPRNNAATAASAASVRALTSQAIAFYFRAPVKAFFRTRVDYLAYARSVHNAQAQLHVRPLGADRATSRLTAALQQTWTWMRATTPGVLTSAVRHDGWAVIPHQVLPPLIANVSVGAVLYTSYLQILGKLHPESAKGNKRAYPPPEPVQTFAAGFLAGSIQSVLAAPLDAIQARYDHRDLMPASGKGKPRSMWSFSAEKLREIGLRGIFAGWGLSFMKDSMGSAVFFTTFEYVKAQGYINFVRWYYGGLSQEIVDLLAMKRPTDKDKRMKRNDQSKHEDKPTVIRPHYAIEPAFLLLAGIGASFGQQILLHPLNHIQTKHWDHLEELDAKASRLRESQAANPEKPHRRWRMMRAYYRAYQETWAQLAAEAKAEGISLTKWFYRGFWWNTIRQVPSTSAGLIIFELVRRKYGMGSEEIRITKDGYDILLT